MAGQILTVNGGSSSVKVASFIAGPLLRVTRSGTFAWTAEAALMDWIGESAADGGLAAAGHRVVHGGPDYHEPQKITPQLMQELRQLSPLDPAHLPEEISLMETLQRRFPQLPQVACFDTAFHHDLPRVARLLPIPRRYEAQGVRRYGFHGLSYEFLMGELAIGGAAAARGRVILATSATARASLRYAMASPSTPAWRSPRRRAYPWAPVPATSIPAWRATWREARDGRESDR